LFSSARSLEEEAFRAVSAGYEDRDLKQRTDRRLSVVYCGDVGKGEEEITHYHCSTWAESSNDTRARQEKGGMKEGLMFLLRFTLFLSGRSGADS
jgi:hypothetical protein